MQALQKQRLKQMEPCFEVWRAGAKQGQVHLRGASGMLQWRKLLRIWKVLVLLSAACLELHLCLHSYCSTWQVHTVMSFFDQDTFLH